MFVPKLYTHSHTLYLPRWVTLHSNTASLPTFTVTLRILSANSGRFKPSAEAPSIEISLAENKKLQAYKKMMVSSTIDSARPTVSPVVNIVLAWNLFCFLHFEKWGLTDGRTCAKTMIVIVGRPSGSMIALGKDLAIGFETYYISRQSILDT